MKDNRHRVFVALGANLGDRQATLQAARAQLLPAVEVVRSSSLYETPPWGVIEQPPFLNAVCEARTTLKPEELLDYLKHLEQTLGRVASTRWGPRSIDLDILLYDDLVLTTPRLTIPHARLHERAFVLVPLRELAPQLQHPTLKTSIAELAATVGNADIQTVAEQW